MPRISKLMLCSVAVVALAACSSNGRVAMNGGLGGSRDNPPPQAEDPGPTAPTEFGESLEGTTGAVLTAAGNLVEGDGDDPVDHTIDPLARVSVDGETIGDGSTGATLIGASVASEEQQQGELATLGVLNNGQVVAANNVGAAGNGDLIGATAGEDQVIGASGQQQVGVGLLSPSTTSGDIASVNLLSGDQPIDIDIEGATNGADGGIVEGVTDTVEGLINGGG